MVKNNRWNRGKSNAPGWHLAAGKWTQHQQPVNADEKNWRCPGCGNTENPGWSTWCWRASCSQLRPPPAEPKPKPASPTAEPDLIETGPSLAEARALLGVLKANCSDGHSFVTDQAALVHKLEQAQQASVSATERLQKLWASQKTVEHKVKQASDAVDAAHTTAEAAAKKLRERLENLDEAQSQLRALRLEVAEASAALHAESSQPPEPTPTPVQAIARLVENANADTMTAAGLPPATLVTMLQQLTTLVALATSAAPIAPPAPARVPAPPTPLQPPPANSFLGINAPAPTPEEVQQQQHDEQFRIHQQQQNDLLQQHQQQEAERLRLLQQQKQQQQQQQQQQQEETERLQQVQQQQQLEAEQLQQVKAQPQIDPQVIGIDPPSSFPLAQPSQASQPSQLSQHDAAGPASAAIAETAQGIVVPDDEDMAEARKGDARKALASADELLRQTKIARIDTEAADLTEEVQVG